MTLAPLLLATCLLTPPLTLHKPTKQWVSTQQQRSPCEKPPGEAPTACELELMYHLEAATQLYLEKQVEVDVWEQKYDIALQMASEPPKSDGLPWWGVVGLVLVGAAAGAAVGFAF